VNVQNIINKADWNNRHVTYTLRILSVLDLAGYSDTGSDYKDQNRNTCSSAWQYYGRILSLQEAGLKKTADKGFTLVELAIVLVIVGLLVGMGATLIGPLTKKAKYNESQNVVKEVYNAVTGYALANKKLPVDLTSVGVRTKDGYAQNLLYYAAGNITAADFCTTQGTYLTVDDDGTTRTNVAFIVFSQGENRCNQTGTASPFAIADAGVVAGACTDPNAGYDDIVMYQDINT